MDWAITARNGNLGVLLLTSSATHLLGWRLLLDGEIPSWLLLGRTLGQRTLAGRHAGTHLCVHGRGRLRLSSLEDGVHWWSLRPAKKMPLLLLGGLHSVRTLLAPGMLL